MAGLIPGLPIYDAAKHAVVAISEDLYRAMSMAMLPIGVSDGFTLMVFVERLAALPELLGAVQDFGL